MKLFPQDTKRREVFEKADRWVGNWLFGEPKTVSTHIGDRIKAGIAKPRHYLAAAFIDLFEKFHCFKNAGKR